MRVFDKLGGPPKLDDFFQEYNHFLRGVDRYEFHLQELIACYSRGDSPSALRREFAFAVQKVIDTDRAILALPGGRHVFAHLGEFAELFRDALVLVAFGLCLRAPSTDIAAIVDRCDRGDPLLEAVTGAAAPGLQKPSGPAQFPGIYDGLYATLTASAPERERLIYDYLSVWYSEKMEGFTFKDAHLIPDTTDYVGYWCFEVAGVVAALNINDATFADHPHYPRDLVASYRAG